MKFQLKFNAIIVMAIAVIATGCTIDFKMDDEGPSGVPVTGISLNKTASVMKIGSTEELIATITPANATNRTVTWESDDESVATVSSTDLVTNYIGLVTSVGFGSTVITVTTGDGGHAADFLVTVYEYGAIGPGGGLIFYITVDGLHGLEVAKVDQGTSHAWSTLSNAFADGISALPTDIGTGSANTNAIIAQNSNGSSAAKLCRDYRGGGFEDWFLPSRDELKTVWDNLVADGEGDYSGVGGFANSPYWSSSEYDENEAWYLHFATGGQSKLVKSSYLHRHVRAIRAF